MAESITHSESVRTTLGAKVLHAFSVFHVWIYRASGGWIGATLFDPPYPWRLLRMCLLTTTGRKSGLQRTTALLCLPDGDRVLLVASYGGRPVTPLWYTNLLATPDAVVQLGRVTRRMRTRTATPSERPELWRRMVKLYPGYENYQRTANREIPIVICEPTGE